MANLEMVEKSTVFSKAQERSPRKRVTRDDEMIFLVSNSLRQILRKPAAVAMTLLLFAIAVVLLSTGVSLRLASSRSLEALESGFSTIGTVEQMPNTSTQVAYWDAWS